MNQVISNGSGQSVSNSTTRYNVLMGAASSDSSWITTEVLRVDIVPVAGTIKDLNIVLDTAPGAGKSYTFTVFKNGSSTNLTLTISGADTSGNDSTNEIDLAAGDRVSIESDPTGTPTSSPVRWSVVFIGDSATDSVLMGGTTFTTTNATTFAPAHGYTGSDTIEADVETIITTAGTINNLFVRLSLAPGGGQSRAITIRKNAGDTTLTATVSESDKTADDTVNSFTVVAGDRIAVKIVSSASPAAAGTQVGIAFVPDSANQFMTASATDLNLSNSATRFLHFSAGDHTPSATETDVQDLTNYSTAKSMRVLLSGSPGAGNNYQFTLRVNGKDTDLTVTISDAATSGVITADVELTNKDLISISSVPTSSPTARSVRICVLQQEFVGGKEFLGSGTSQFLELQTGNAAPFFYVEAIISGNTSIIGNSFTSTNWLLDGGTIDRAKPVFPGDRSNIFSSDVTIKVDNSTQRFSPAVTGSEFFDNDYLESEFNYWGGFVNVSGTALLLQRGSFLLENLKLDSRKNTAFMRLRDKFKKTLQKRIGNTTDVSGTAIQFVISGNVDAKQVIESLLITGAGLTAGALDIQTAHINYADHSMSDQTVADAVSTISEASDGFIFTNREGTLQFVSNLPVFGTAPTPDFTIRESNWATNVNWEQSRDDRISIVNITFGSGEQATVASEATGVTGNSISIQNESIGSTADAIAIASRTRDRFSGQITRLTIPSLWAPTVDVGNIIAVFSTSLGLVGDNFEVYRITENITKGTMKIALLNEDRLTGKWGFLSHETGSQEAGAGEHSAVFAGSGNTESGGWQANWLFFGRDAETATRPGFDEDGNDNNVINPEVTSSGAGGTGIEVLFELY